MRFFDKLGEEGGIDPKDHKEYDKIMKRPKISFTEHARHQMKERNLTQKEIRAAFKNPDKIISQSFRRYRIIKAVKRARKNYLLVIIYEHAGGDIAIITAFLTSKVHKYL